LEIIAEPTVPEKLPDKAVAKSRAVLSLPLAPRGDEGCELDGDEAVDDTDDAE
jgi:hypothetical protein